MNNYVLNCQKLENKSWHILTDTANPRTFAFEEIKHEGNHYCVLPKSAIILILLSKFKRVSMYFYKYLDY